jgi:hypothetical protein
MDSGAALHEDSEYYLGFAICTSFHGVISSFPKKKENFFGKMTKKGKVFRMFCKEDGGKNQIVFYQNDQKKKLYQL